MVHTFTHMGNRFSVDFMALARERKFAYCSINTRFVTFAEHLDINDIPSGVASTATLVG